MRAPNKRQLWVLKVLSVVIVAMALFPPFELVRRSVTVNWGYSFILLPPTKGSLVASVDVSLLLTQFLLVVTAGGLMYLVVGASGRSASGHWEEGAKRGVGCLAANASRALKAVGLGFLHLLRILRVALLLVVLWQLFELTGIAGLHAENFPLGGMVAFAVIKLSFAAAPLVGYLALGSMAIKLHRTWFPSVKPILKHAYSL